MYPLHCWLGLHRVKRGFLGFFEVENVGCCLTRKKRGLNFLQFLPQENVSLKSLYLWIPNAIVTVAVLKINYAHMLQNGTLHYFCFLNFRAHSKWFICCGDPVMYVCYYYYYYYIIFFQCHSNYIFFRHAVCYVPISFYISDVEVNTVSDLPKLSSVQPASCKDLQVRRLLKTMFPSKQFNWSEIDNMGKIQIQPRLKAKLQLINL